MPKILIYLFIFSIFVIFHLSNPAQAHAACSWTTTPAAIEDPKYQGAITLTGSPDCPEFLPNITYVLLAYPQSEEGSPNRYSQFTSDRNTIKQGNREISGKINLASASIGINNLGRWTVKLCTPSPGLSECGGTPGSNPKVFAISSFDLKQPGGQTMSLTANPNRFELGKTPSVTLNNTTQGTTYVLWWEDDWFAAQDVTAQSNNNMVVKLQPGSWNNQSRFNEVGENVICAAVKNPQGGFTNPSCTTKASIFFQNTPVSKQIQCNISPASPTQEDNVSLSVVNLPSNIDVKAKLSVNNQTTDVSPSTGDKTNSEEDGTAKILLGRKLAGGNYTAALYSTNNSLICSKSFVVKRTIPQTAQNGQGQAQGPLITATGEFCDESKGTISTAIGCINTNPVGLVQDFFKLAVGIGGGIALLLMIGGAFQMITSAGNPEGVKHGKEQFTSAIEGLLFIIFSVLLLRIIGVDILGFGKFLGV